MKQMGAVKLAPTEALSLARSCYMRIKENILSRFSKKTMMGREAY